MELREFAESILFAETLEAKLIKPPEEIFDEKPGLPLDLPDHPGRPEQLRFDRGDSPPPLPGLHLLEDEAQRGVLLHFFANHELLATELMALVLLRFPDAPADFRRGVYETLREEQRHTTWYLRRMAQCGVNFGDYPVNGFFWRAVAPMDTPLDYVTRLSLTFEQANLDYARNFAAIFRDSGDAKSATILDRIYRDEIGHVRYGLTWFRRWKNAADSDWEAFERNLAFPLSPSRAKGNGATFNADGRREAGFDADFVRRLQAFQRSKGRTPRVFRFCADAENAMADATYEPRQAVKQLDADFEILAAFVASHEDVVLVRRPPSLAHREKLRDFGFRLPEFVEIGEISGLADRKLAELRPWAWCPQIAELLKPLEANLPAKARKIADCWNERTRRLFSKANDVAWLAELLQAHPAPFWDAAQVGRAVRDPADLPEDAAETGDWLVKAPFGASGQRNQPWQGEATRRWAEKIIARQGCVIVEPRLPRIFDFSAQFEMSAAGLRSLGYVRLENNSRGQFLAAQCGPKPCQGLPKDLARFLGELVFPFYGQEFREFLEARLAATGYQGPVGIDALVFRDSTGKLALKPIVEINPRYTMGRLAVELRKRVAAGRCVRLEFGPADAAAPDGGIILNEPAETAVILRVAARHTDW